MRVSVGGVQLTSVAVVDGGAWNGLDCHGATTSCDGALSVFVVGTDGAQPTLTMTTLQAPHRDDSPLLCCDYVPLGRTAALAVAGGLSSAKLVVGLLCPPPDEEPVGGQEEVQKRRRVEALPSWAVSPAALSSCVTTHEVVIGGNRGAINAVACERPPGGSSELWMVSAWLGFQNGDVIRVSLRVTAGKGPGSVVIVGGTDAVVHRHSMDVRSLSLGDKYVCSASDDGTLLLSSVVASGSSAADQQNAIKVCDSELLCCRFLDAGRVAVAVRERRLLVVDVARRAVVAEHATSAVVKGISGPSLAWVSQTGVFVWGEVRHGQPSYGGAGAAVSECTNFFALANSQGLFVFGKSELK
jgi:hypothetical protein